MKLVIVFASLVAIATVVDGFYTEDWPAQDPKQNCNGWGDCQYGERCHSISYPDVSYCVPDSCQNNADCPDVGHIGYGLIKSQGCNSSTCVYEEAEMIAK